MLTYRELRQLLNTANEKGSIANEQRSEAFKFAIDEMIKAFTRKLPPQSDGNDAKEVSAEDRQWIEQFLVYCWNTVKNTDLAYTQDSQNSASRLCIGLADLLFASQDNAAPTAKKNKFQYLIPDLQEPFCKMFPAKQLKKDINLYSIDEFVLDDRGTKLIHVEEIIEQSTYAVTKDGKWRPDSRHTHNILVRGKYDFKETTQALLSPSEQKRVVEHTPKTGDYCNKLKNVTIFDIYDLLIQITYYAGLSSSNKLCKGGKGTDGERHWDSHLLMMKHIWLFRMIVPFATQTYLCSSRINFPHPHLSDHKFNGFLDLFDRALSEPKTSSVLRNYPEAARIDCSDCISDDMASFITQFAELLDRSRKKVFEIRDFEDIAKNDTITYQKRKQNGDEEIVTNETRTKIEDKNKFDLDELKPKVAFFAAKEFRESLAKIKNEGKYSPAYREDFVTNHALCDRVTNTFILPQIEIFFQTDANLNNSDILWSKISKFMAAKNNLLLELITECIDKSILTETKGPKQYTLLIHALMTSGALSKDDLIDSVVKKTKNPKITASFVCELFLEEVGVLNLEENLQTLIGKLAQNPATLQYAVNILKKLYSDEKLKEASFTGVIRSLVVAGKKEEAKNLIGAFLSVTAFTNESGAADTTKFDYFCNSFDKLLQDGTFTIDDVAAFTKVVREKHPNIANSFVQHLFSKFLATGHETLKIQKMFSVFNTNELIGNFSALLTQLINEPNVNKKSLLQCFLNDTGITYTDRASLFLKCIQSGFLGECKEAKGRLKKSTRNLRIVLWVAAILAVIFLVVLPLACVIAASAVWCALSFCGIVFSAASMFPWLFLGIGIAALVVPPFLLLLGSIIFGPIAIVKSKVDGKAHVKLYTVNNEGVVVVCSREMNANKVCDAVVRRSYWNTDKFQNDDKPWEFISERSFGAENDVLVEAIRSKKAFLFNGEQCLNEIRNDSDTTCRDFRGKNVVLINENKILAKIEQLQPT